MTTTSSGQQSTDSLNGKLTFEQDKNRIIGRDGDNTPRLAIVADGVNFSMKVSPEGFDVLTADDGDLIFNSNNNLFKIVGSGTSSVAAPGVSLSNSQATATNNTVINHNLGYVPIVLAYTSFGNSPIPFSNMGIASSTPGNWIFVNQYFQVDSTTLTLINSITSSATGVRSDTGLGMNVKYYLLQETAS